MSKPDSVMVPFLADWDRVRKTPDNHSLHHFDMMLRIFANDYDRLEAEVVDLNAQLAMAQRQPLYSTRRKAARYEWLRDVGDATWRPFGVRAGYSAEQADAAIDAAIAAMSQEKPE